MDALERAELGDGIGRIKRGETEGTAMLSLNDLSVTLDDGTAVVGEAEVVIEPGERVLVAGESGAGKSTLVRAIAGLWPWGGGSVNSIPTAACSCRRKGPTCPRAHFAAVAYPGLAEDWTREEIGEVLHKVGLDHLKEKIEEDGPWDQTLSGGEKQRLAFARLLLHNPDIVVLDEATSALDEKGQDKMMDLVTRELPNATIVSVAHRAELEAFHSRKIVLERRKRGAKLVSDVDLIPRKGRRRLLGRLLRRRNATGATPQLSISAVVRVADYQFARRVADNSGVSSEGGSACETKSISTRRSAEPSSERSVRASLSEGELPASLKAQLDRINQHQSSPSVVPEQEWEIGKAAVAPRGLASPIWWTTRWRTRLRRARK
jgi:energy-coupling factor transporter ATP-binding protein EcfA2